MISKKQSSETVNKELSHVYMVAHHHRTHSICNTCFPFFSSNWLKNLNWCAFKLWIEVPIKAHELNIDVMQNSGAGNTFFVLRYEMGWQNFMGLMPCFYLINFKISICNMFYGPLIFININYHQLSPV